MHPEYRTKRVIFYYRTLFHGVENPCTICNPIGEHSSIKENEIKDFINIELGVKTVKHKINKSEIDIYSPEYNIGVEFNGLYWHSDKFKNSNYHLNKTILCNENNIDLIHVFEDEWVHKKEIVKSIIRSRFKRFDFVINSSQCEIKEIDSAISQTFLNENCVSDAIECEINIGLFYENSLCSIMCFNKINEFEYTVIRMCDKLNTQINDGSNKLFHHYKSIYVPNTTKTSIDSRYAELTKYESMGFKIVGYTTPQHSFVAKRNLMRSVDKPNDSHFKIFDCGQIIMVCTV
jgi:hypothetical protein